MANCIICNKHVDCSCSLVQGKYCNNCYSQIKNDVHTKQPIQNLPGSTKENRLEDTKFGNNRIE